MIIIHTHNAICDNKGCSNYGYECPAYSLNGSLAPVECGVCGKDITHTCISN